MNNNLLLSSSSVYSYSYTEKYLSHLVCQNRNFIQDFALLLVVLNPAVDPSSLTTQSDTTVTDWRDCPIFLLLKAVFTHSSISTTWSLLKCVFQALPQTHRMQICIDLCAPRWLICMLKFKRHCGSVSHLYLLFILVGASLFLEILCSYKWKLLLAVWLHLS